MPRRTTSYREWQMQKLSNPERAISYLNAALRDSNDAFLIALGKVAQANQMARVAKEAGVQRETLYRSLSGQGNPTFDTLSSILKAVNLRIHVGKYKEKGAVPALHTSTVVVRSDISPNISEQPPDPPKGPNSEYDSLHRQPLPFIPGSNAWSNDGAQLYANSIG
jgi:probable addiction module antidote protein